MTDTVAQLLEQALSLRTEERAELIDSLLASLYITDRELDELWIRESEDRIDAMDRGELATIPAVEVFARINEKRGK